MNAKAAAFVLTLISVPLIGAWNAQKAAAANPSFNSSGNAGTDVLTPQEAQTLYLSCFRQARLFGNPGRSQSAEQTYPAPTAIEVSQAEDSLRAYTQLSRDALIPISAALEYKPQQIVLTYDLHQYAGVMQGGKRLILINGCTRSGIPVFATAIGKPAINFDWPDLLARFSDGGSAFRAAYDPAARRIIYLVYDDCIEPKPAQAYGWSLWT